MVAGAVWLVFFSTVLAVESVRVAGVRTIAEQRIAKVADVPRGVPLARVDLGDVRERVQEIPVVESAEVSLAWPHAIAVTVTERTAVAAVESGSGRVLIDAEGVTFRRKGGVDARLPVVRADGRRAAEEAAAAIAALPGDLAGRVREVEATTMDSITLYLRDGRTVVWGSAADSMVKAEVLGALLGREGTVYDVSVPGAPTVSVN
ncbi:MAG: FtsQ-type POTRA domain-containing protein [Propionibacteriales bacterium]|nr:FtsQ-type POTRA domain-containing protein [Propionibacteriales bacterium]